MLKPNYCYCALCTYTIHPFPASWVCESATLGAKKLDSGTAAERPPIWVREAWLPRSRSRVVGGFTNFSIPCAHMRRAARRLTGCVRLNNKIETLPRDSTSGPTHMPAVPQLTRLGSVEALEEPGRLMGYTRRHSLH